MGDGAGHLGHTDHPVVQLHLEPGQQGGLDVPDDLLGAAGLVGEDVDFTDNAVFHIEFRAQNARQLCDQVLPGRRAG